MSHRVSNVLLVTCLLPCLAVPLPAQAENSALVLHGGVGQQVSVWRVWSSGIVERLPFQFTNEGGTSGLGDVGPVVSPDQRWIAFARDNDLWLLEVETGKEKQITHVGQPFDESYVSVFIYITAWSSDSGKLLYHVSHGVYGCEGDCPDLQIRPQEYGFYIYDLKNGTTRRLKVPGELEIPGPLQAWLPNGDLILTPQDAEYLNERLVRFDALTKTEEPLGTPRGGCGQLDVTQDGRWLVATFHATGNDNQIIKIDLQSNAVHEVSKKGGWAEYQWPRFSPSGSRIAFVHSLQQPHATPQETLVVEERQVYACAERIDFQWIDDTAIAVVCQNELIIVDAETGEEKGRHPLD